MAVFQPIAAFGTKIQIGNGASPEVFTTIDGLGDIAGPQASIDEEETTSHSTAPLRAKTFAPTLQDFGSISFPIFYNPQATTHTDSAPVGSNPPGLGYLFLNTKFANFRIVASDPSATTRQFAGFVKDFKEAYPVKGLIKREVTIRFGSAPVNVP